MKVFQTAPQGVRLATITDSNNVAEVVELKMFRLNKVENYVQKTFYLLLQFANKLWFLFPAA